MAEIDLHVGAAESSMFADGMSPVNVYDYFSLSKVLNCAALYGMVLLACASYLSTFKLVCSAQLVDYFIHFTRVTIKPIVCAAYACLVVV